MKRSLLLAIVLICALGGAFAFFVLRPDSPRGSESGTVRFWKDEIEKEGAEKAYEHFKTHYGPLPFHIQHVAAHIMGEALFEAMGIDGFTVCDSSFAFGCYHALAGRIIAEQGIGVVDVLAEKCKERYGINSTGCEHGIGHGLLEHLGSERLSAALAACDKTRQVHPLFGCTSGVFMEYNAGITFDERGTPRVIPRQPEENLHAPCDTIPERFRPSCFYELSLWWKNSALLSDEKIGRLCSEVPYEEERSACYRGWGTVVAENARYGAEEIRAMCGHIVEKAGADLCQFGAASRLFAIKEHRDTAAQICMELDKNMISECLRFDSSESAEE